MKSKINYSITIIMFLLLLGVHCLSQANSDSEQLLNRIKALRNTDTQSISPSDERIRNKALLILYKRFISSFEGKDDQELGKFKREIANAQNMILSLEVVLENSDDSKVTETSFEKQKEETQPVVKPDKKPAKIQPTVPKITATPKTVSSQVDSKTNNYKDAPKVLLKKVDEVVGSVLSDIAANEQNPEEQIASQFPQLFSFSLSDAVLANDKDNPVPSLEPVRFFLETARTDKQIGTSSSSGGATSMVEKPGFPFLLGIAIENGVIEKNVQDTVLTLSTSPSALFAIGQPDTTKAYKNAGIFNKIGLSASFNINSENPLLNNATRGQLRDYSVRFRFLGDRSSRSPQLEKIWNKTMAPAIQDILSPLNATFVTLDEDDKLVAVRDGVVEKLKGKIKETINTAEFKALSIDEQTQQLKNIILNVIKADVVDSVSENRIAVSETTKTAIKKHFQELVVAQVRLNTIREDVLKQLDEFSKGPLGTIAYTSHRDTMGNYSDFKALFEQNNTIFKPLKLVANAGYSFYHKPNAMMNQKKSRDLSFALSLEGKVLSPFNSDNEDLSQITYSFTGSYRRLFENKGIAGRKADLASFQFLANFPFLRGMIFPFSVTYSNATELERKQGVRVNFGIKLDADKLFEITKFNRKFK
jgi:hypothetical protein